MLDPELLKILVCPACKGELDYDAPNAVLDCPRCRLRYPIDDDVPIMLVEEAKPY
ncbi:MAG TPA: Trm112 family protein [Acidobacteriota bacterium]|nr:Trm112 family protein [Acidobacteriota bacterium]